MLMQVVHATLLGGAKKPRQCIQACISSGGKLGLTRESSPPALLHLL